MKIDKTLVSQSVKKPLTTVKSEKTDGIEQKDGFVQSSPGETLPTLSKEEILQLQPKEKPGLVKNVLSETVETSKEAGDAVGRVMGNIFGIGGIYVGATVGTLGGAAAMGALGVTAGVPLAILSGKDGFSIIGGALATGGPVAQAGILIGTACGIAGGYYLGSKLGYVVGAVPTAVISAPLGVAKGIGKTISGKTEEVIEQPKEPKVKRQRSKAEKITSNTLAGLGGLIGLTGGGGIGAVIGSGVGIGTAIASKEAIMSAMASGGVAGLVVGGVTGAILLGVGGYKIVDLVADGADYVMKGLSKGKERVELDMKYKELDTRLAGLEQAGKDIQAKKTEAQEYFKGQFAGLEKEKADEDKHVTDETGKLQKQKDDMDQHVIDKNKEFASVMDEVIKKTDNQDKIAQERADGRLDDLKKAEQNKYADRKAGLQNFEGSMDARDKEYDRKEVEKDKIVDTQAEQRKDATQADLEAKYQDRKSANNQVQSTLEQRQKDYDNKLSDKPLLVKDESDKHYAKKEGELQGGLDLVKGGLQKDLDKHKSDLKGQYDDKKGDYKRTYDDRERTLNSTYTMKASEVGREEQEVKNLRSDVSHKEGELRDIKRKTEQKENEANQIISSIPGQKQQYLNEASRARTEASSLGSQIGTAQRELGRVESDASSAQSNYMSSANEFNQLQSEINSLNSQIQNAMRK